MVASKNEHLSVCVYAVPGAKQTEAMGRYICPLEPHSCILRLRVAAPPQQGRANEAIVKWLAKTFAVRRSQVVFERGQASRTKRFTLQFASSAQREYAETIWRALLAHPEV